MKFKVDARLDGASQITVEVKKTAGGTDAVVLVRPKHSRRVYSGLLSDVALIIAARDAKAALAAGGISVPKPRKVSKSEIKSMSGAVQYAKGEAND